MGVDDAPELARTIVNASFHNADFSTRIWLYQGQLKNELSSLLSNGIVQGIHSRELAKQLEKKIGVSKANAERLMRTEMARVQIAAQEESYKANGYARYVFLAIGTACPDCLAINGQHFDVAGMQAGENAPPMHPNCRCSTAAWMDRAETMKQIKAMGQVKNTNQIKMNLQFFARSSKDAINEKIRNNLLDKEKFDKCLEYFKEKFKQGVYTPIGRVYDSKNAFYHIIDRHDYMLNKSNIDRIVNTLSNPKAIFESKDKIGIPAQAYIEDNAENTLLVIVRKDVVTAYEPDKSYLDKIKKGEQLWKRP